MLSLAQLSNTDVAAIAALSSAVTAIVSSLFTSWSNKDKNEIEESATLFDAYNDVVNNLQTEISRLQSELNSIRDEMKKCESSNKLLLREIHKLKDCVERLSGDAERIESIITAEYLPEDL